MELQTYLKQQRDRNLAVSAQITLGQIIDKLEKIGTKTEDGKDKTIQFDFGSAIPTTLDSWRGAYDELALGYELSGYDGEGDWENTTAEKLLQELKSAIGKHFEGWKGGNYKIIPGDHGSKGTYEGTATKVGANIKFEILYTTPEGVEADEPLEFIWEPRP